MTPEPVAPLAVDRKAPLPLPASKWTRASVPAGVWARASLRSSFCAAAACCSATVPLEAFQGVRGMPRMCLPKIEHTQPGAAPWIDAVPGLVTRLQAPGPTCHPRTAWLGDLSVRRTGYRHDAATVVFRGVSCRLRPKSIRCVARSLNPRSTHPSEPTHHAFSAQELRRPRAYSDRPVSHALHHHP